MLRTLAQFEDLSSALAALFAVATLALPPAPVFKRTNAALTARDSECRRSSLELYLRSMTIALSTSSLPSTNPTLKEARTLLENFLLSQPNPLRMPPGEIASLFEKVAVKDEEQKQQRKQWVEAGKKVRSLRSAWGIWKRDLIHSGQSLSCSQSR